jgi:tRNA dimethylallyltransferase
MATNKVELPLVVIVGPTASGKTGLAIDIAKRFNGEIICADSRTVYKGMDIATAKPTKMEQQNVVHHGLDIVEPDERFSVADFKKYADDLIIKIKKRGHIPILVGGTGLYIDSVLFDYKFGSDVNKKLRLELQQKSLNDLYSYCEEHKINLPENYKNKRYVIRAIENAQHKNIRKDEPVYKNIIVGITTDKIELQKRIAKRIEQMLENGVVGEATKLGKKYGWKYESMKSNIYPLVHKYIENDMTIEELKQSAQMLDQHLVKRQLTWLRRNKFIHWATLTEANTYLSDQLAVTE